MLAHDARRALGVVLPRELQRRAPLAKVFAHLQRRVRRPRAQEGPLRGVVVVLCERQDVAAEQVAVLDALEPPEHERHGGVLCVAEGVARSGELQDGHGGVRELEPAVLVAQGCRKGPRQLEIIGCQRLPACRNLHAA